MIKVYFMYYESLGKFFQQQQLETMIVLSTLQ